MSTRPPDSPPGWVEVLIMIAPVPIMIALIYFAIMIGTQ